MCVPAAELLPAAAAVLEPLAPNVRSCAAQRRRLNRCGSATCSWLLVWCLSSGL